ncbi:MAG: DUF86 domain-containing protein [Gracilimonas sp.]|nr:DUF86 domain-containing protein [Gracilimonas sp.]
MSKRNPDIYLHDILDSIQQIEEYLDGVSKNDFYNNLEKQDAVLRRLEIVGEADKHISDEIRTEYKNIPWRKIAGMRDVIIHEYFGVTLSMIWIVAKRDLPELKKKIQKVISDRS